MAIFFGLFHLKKIITENPLQIVFLSVSVTYICCYLLSEDSQFFGDSFKKYYENIFQKDSHLEDLYFQIERNLFRPKVHGNFLYHNGVPLKELLIQTKTRLGTLRTTKIVKKLFGAEYVQEGRINEEYIKHRFLFFALNSLIAEDSYIV